MWQMACKTRILTVFPFYFLADIIKCGTSHRTPHHAVLTCVRIQRHMRQHARHKCIRNSRTVTIRFTTIITTKNTRGGRKGNIIQTFLIWTLIMIENLIRRLLHRGVSYQTITRAVLLRHRRSGAFIIPFPHRHHRRQILRDNDDYYDYDIFYIFVFELLWLVLVLLHQAAQGCLEYLWEFCQQRVPVINWEHLPSTEGLFQLFLICFQHGYNNVCSSVEVPILLFIIIWECDPYAFLRCTTWVVSSCSERVNQGFLPLHTLHFSRFYIQFCSPFNNWSKVFKNHYFIPLGDDFNTQLPVVRRFRLALAGFFCSKQWQPPGTRRNRRSTCGCVFRFAPRPNVSMTV